MKYQTFSLKQFFAVKATIYYVAIEIFSHVKITFSQVNIMFSIERSPRISLVII